MNGKMVGSYEKNCKFGIPEKKTILFEKKKLIDFNWLMK